MQRARYDRIGRSYGATRAEDPRIAAAIHAALGDARTVLNVGAGSGLLRAARPRRHRGRALGGHARAAPARRRAVHRRARRGAAVRRRLVRRGDGGALRPPLGATGRRPARAAPRRAAARSCSSGTPRFAGAFWLTARLPALVPGPAGGLARRDRGGARRDRGRRRADPARLPRRLPDGLLAPARGLSRPRGAGQHLRLLAPPAGRGRRDGRGAPARTSESGAWARRNADLLERDAFDLGYRVLVAG